MTQNEGLRNAWTQAAMVGVVALGWLLRAYPLFTSAESVPVDYDDGVYFSAAALLWHGALPYRDFVFAHPPGILLFLAPGAALARALDPALGFVASRWMSTIVGAVNIALVGRLALRWRGPIAGLAAAVAYAVHPQISNYERGPYLEPVLNLVSLAAASLWLRRANGGRWMAAGAACGLACSVKTWGLLSLAACLASLPEGRRIRAAGQLLIGALAAFALVALPFIWAAGDELFRQAAWFHWIRPADGVPPAERLPMILQRYWTLNLLAALAGLAAVLRGHGRFAPAVPDDSAGSRQGRFWATAFLLLLFGFMASPTFWIEYCAHLAPSQAILAGAGAATLWGWVSSARSAVRAAALVLLAGAAVPPLVLTWIASRSRMKEVADLGQFIKQSVPTNSCMITFEPIWAVAASRLPWWPRTSPALVDPYAAMLMASLDRGVRSRSITEVFHAAPAQQAILRSLENCRYVALGRRREWQLSEESKAWLRGRYFRRYLTGDQEGISLWEQR